MVMDVKEILIMIGSTFGTVYRSVFTKDLNSIKKFIVSIFLASLCGLIIIGYARENQIADYKIVIISLISGLLIHNITQIILGVGAQSEKSIIRTITRYIDLKVTRVLGTDLTEKTDNEDDESSQKKDD